MVPVTTQVSPVATYIESYHSGDRDRLITAFTEDAVVSFNNSAPSVGLQAIKDSHVQIGRFQYVVEHELTNGNVAVIEGQMYGVKNGQKVESVPIAFAWVLELTDDGEKITAWRKYYDGKRVAMAMDAMKG